MSVTIDSEPTKNSRSADFDPLLLDLGDFHEDGVFFKVFYRNVAWLNLRAQRG